MEDYFTITDFDDKPVAVGTRVCTWDADLEVPADVDAVVGVVTDLGDWDGDTDDYGRTIGIPPSITVRFDDGTTEHFTTCEWTWRNPDQDKVEEVNAL